MNVVLRPRPGAPRSLYSVNHGCGRRKSRSAARRDITQAAADKQMRDLGVALTPENRKDQGLVQLLSTRVNLCLASLNRVASRGFLTADRENSVVQRNVRELDIAVANTNAPVAFLSGGNQQKVLLARWLLRESRILILDEPTKGIDIGAKHEIYFLIDELVRSGKGILMISSEIEEILGLVQELSH